MNTRRWITLCMGSACAGCAIALIVAPWFQWLQPLAFAANVYAAWTCFRDLPPRREKIGPVQGQLRCEGCGRLHALVYCCKRALCIRCLNAHMVTAHNFGTPEYDAGKGAA